MKIKTTGRERNASVFLCVWPTSDTPRAQLLTRATKDMSDRAHTIRDDDGLLMPAAHVEGQARPRRYPESQMTGRGVAFDSMFDELYERQRKLDDELGGVAGISYGCGGRENGGTVSAMYQVERMSGGRARIARAIIERRVTSNEQ